MVGRFAAKLAAYVLRHVDLQAKDRDNLFVAVLDLFKKKSLSNEERQMLTAMLLDRLGALPLHAKISVDKAGRVFVNGRSLSTEESERLRQAAAAMQRNAARKLVRETVTFLAMAIGTIKSVNAEDMLFGKAALFFLQEEDVLYDALNPEGLEDDE